MLYVRVPVNPGQARTLAGVTSTFLARNRDMFSCMRDVLTPSSPLVWDVYYRSNRSTMGMDDEPKSSSRALEVKNTHFPARVQDMLFMVSPLVSY